MSEQGKLITVFGGSGFVGTQLVQELARRGYRIRVAVRRPDLAGHVRMYGFPGQIAPIQANLRFPESVHAAVRGASMVINLAGISYEKGRQKFRAVHTLGAKTVAEAARNAGIGRLIHVSALGADAKSPSAFLRSKAAGEADVVKAFPEALIVRPAVIFGPDDRFFNIFGNLARLSPVLPVLSGETLVQPVNVVDVADAIAKLADGAGQPGDVYELGGPETETMRALIERVNVLSMRNRPLVPLAAGLAKPIASLISILPRPLITADQVVRLGIETLVSEKAAKAGRTLAGLGITPTSLDAVLPTYLWRFRRNGEFDKQIAA